MVERLDPRNALKLHDFIQANFPNVASFEQALSRHLSYSPTQLIVAASVDQTATKIIQHAHASGWDMLLAFCLIFNRYTVTQLGNEILSTHLQIGLTLLQDLFTLPLRECEIAACYEGAVTQWSRADLPEHVSQTMEFMAYAIMAAQQAADPLVDSPLLAFLNRIIAHRKIEEEEIEKIRRFWELSKRRLNLTGKLIVDREAPATHCTVQIELRETSDSSASTPKWLRAASLRFPGVKEPVRISDSNPDQKQTQETMAGFLGDLLNTISERKIAPENTTFEFFVTGSSILRAVDQWLIPFEDGFSITLGRKYPVVLRHGKRSEYGRRATEKRWAKLLDATGLAENQIIRRGASGEREALYEELAGAEDVLCVVLDSHVDPTADLGKNACVQAALAAGIPLIFWARRDAPTPELCAQFSQWSALPPRELSKLVFDFRKSAPRDNPVHLGGHLTLVFENADLWPGEGLVASGVIR